MAGGEASSRTDEVQLTCSCPNIIPVFLQQWQIKGLLVAMSVVLVQLASSFFEILSGSEYFQAVSTLIQQQYDREQIL